MRNSYGWPRMVPSCRTSPWTGAVSSWMVRLPGHWGRSGWVQFPHLGLSWGPGGLNIELSQAGRRWYRPPGFTHHWGREKDTQWNKEVFSFSLTALWPQDSPFLLWTSDSLSLYWKPVDQMVSEGLLQQTMYEAALTGVMGETCFLLHRLYEKRQWV